jgi:hypothetical protein
MKNWQKRHNDMKKAVGMAPYGTKAYWRNAAKVLSVHAGQGMRSETRAKLTALADSDDPITRHTAREALSKS